MSSGLRLADVPSRSPRNLVQPRPRGDPLRNLTLWLLVLWLWAPAQAQAPVPGQRAPDFALPDLHGNRVALEDFRGRVVLLNFWAWWCDTWKDELRRLKQLRAANPQLDFEVLFVSVDSRDRSLAEPLLLEEGVFFPVLVDHRSEVSRGYGVTTVPTLVLLDEQGVVRYVHQGYPGNSLLLQELTACQKDDRRALSNFAEEQSVPSGFLLPEERRLWELVNDERKQRGLPRLALVPAMTEVGREYVQRMIAEEIFTHAAPETPDIRLRARGIPFLKMGENLAEAPTPAEALQAMLESPLHKMNLLNPGFQQAGVAAISNGSGGFLFCLLFASR